MKTTKELILKYLNRQYQFTLSTYTSYALYDKIDKTNVGLKVVLNDIKLMFGLEGDELMKIFDEWADQKSTELQNKVTDIQYKIYEKTGSILELTAGDINQIIAETEGYTFMPYSPIQDPE